MPETLEEYLNRTHHENMVEQNSKDDANVQKQKNWLASWYQQRLPVVGKPQLQFIVDEGLKTPYYLPSRKYFDPNSPDAQHEAAGYYEGSDTGSKVVLERTYDSTPIHEFNHAVQSYGGPHNMTYLFTGESDHKNTPADTPYYQRPSEQHSRIMEIRYNANLDPNKTDYTLEDVKNMQTEKHGAFYQNSGIFKDLHKGGMSDEDIQRALNTWASNSVKSNTSFQRNDGTYYARFGGSLNYFDYFK